MFQSKQRAPVCVAAFALSLSAAASAGTITGEVDLDGKPARGAMVTAFTPDTSVAQTVFTDARGYYRLETELTGKLRLRARAALAADSVMSIDMSSAKGAITQRFDLKKLVTAKEISDSLPASLHFARLHFSTQAEREQFQTDCTPCHQIGNVSTRRPRPLEEWKAMMPAMLAYADYTTQYHANEYAAALENAFNATPISPPEHMAVDEGALTAKITEWKLPHSLFPHDTDYYPADGKFYTVDLFDDKIWVTDPKSNITNIIPIPDLGIPIGGSFAGRDGVPTWVPHVRHGNHSLQISPKDGLYYLTESVGGRIAVFDPLKNTYKAFEIGGNALWPHTLRFDSKGIVWFTLNLTNQIGRFDPSTGKSTLIELPNTPYHKDDPTDQRIPAPYGIDINPLDDSVWYTKVWASKIGRVDNKTLQVQEWEPPVKAPKKARFDSTGGFWMPGFGDGKIARLDTKTMKSEVFEIPTLGPGATEAPYALAVNRRNQDVWVSANQSDRMFRFIPATKTWTAYPMPTKEVYLREIVITPDGRACSPSSPQPPTSPAIDGDNPYKLICIEPDGNKR